jgi:hypothetical protein
MIVSNKSHKKISPFFPLIIEVKNTQISGEKPKQKGDKK